jgi:lipopolysaccharide/colanic/teichoic acid biosynthesis glycosyltransferase
MIKNILLKRLIDFISATLGLIILSPFFFLISIIIKVSSIGPVIFVQKRIGQFGKPFNMYKFRTMIDKSSSQNHITTLNDKRITSVGRFLRKYKLDELPELFNVFIGNMSLVGPRPDVPGYADQLEGEDRKILELKPGITGIACLTYANEEKLLATKKNPEVFNDTVIWPHKVTLNLEYYYTNNVLMDFRIIFSTIFRTNY